MFFFCSFIQFDRSDKILTCLKTCLWNPGTYRHKIVRLSSAQFGLVMNYIVSCITEECWHIVVQHSRTTTTLFKNDDYATLKALLKKWFFVYTRLRSILIVLLEHMQNQIMLK